MSEHTDFVDNLFTACVSLACIVLAVIIAIIGGLYAWFS